MLDSWFWLHALQLEFLACLWLQPVEAIFEQPLSAIAHRTCVLCIIHTADGIMTSTNFGTIRFWPLLDIETIFQEMLDPQASAGTYKKPFQLRSNSTICLTSMYPCSLDLISFRRLVGYWTMRFVAKTSELPSHRYHDCTWIRRLQHPRPRWRSRHGWGCRPTSFGPRSRSITAYWGASTTKLHACIFNLVATQSSARTNMC